MSWAKAHLDLSLSCSLCIDIDCGLHGVRESMHVRTDSQNVGLCAHVSVTQSELNKRRSHESEGLICKTGSTVSPSNCSLSKVPEHVLHMLEVYSGTYWLYW